MNVKNRFDPYRWLEKIDSPEVKEWVDAQNNRAHSVLDEIKERKVVKKRLEELFQLGDLGVPVPRKGRYFFEKREAHNDLKILYVQDGIQGLPKILIDPNVLSADKTASLRTWYPSPDGKWVAYSLSEASNDAASVYIINVENGKKIDDFIPADLYPNLYSPIEWSSRSNGFWYTKRSGVSMKGNEKYNQKIYYHCLEDFFKNDKLIFGDNIAKEDIPWVETSSDGRCLLVTVYKPAEVIKKTELYLFDFQNQDRGFVAVTNNDDALFFGKISNDTIFILTNHNAPLWKLMSVSIKDAVFETRRWKNIILESELTLHKIEILNGYIFAELFENAHSVLKQYRTNGDFVSEIGLPTFGSLTAMNAEKDGEEIFFGFTSFLTPHIVYRFNRERKELEIFKEIKTDIDNDHFVMSQVRVKSNDGTLIPMSLIYQKNLKLDGNNPVMMYGYGGFGVSIVPRFDPYVIPFIEHGGIYAVVNIRGGGEFGEKWHLEGARMKKQNVFDDFISAAKWLIANQYTNVKKLGMMGWSNGGLLVATIVTQKPELFKVAIIGAPVTDMLRYQLFLGGRQWIAEYGCREEGSDVANNLLAYSPYHNVKKGLHYPATLIVTADNDDRVHPGHAYKMAARLQEANASPNPIVLLTEKKAGHNGPLSTNRKMEHLSNIWGFIFYHLDV